MLIDMADIEALDRDTVDNLLWQVLSQQDEAAQQWYLDEWIKSTDGHIWRKD